MPFFTNPVTDLTAQDVNELLEMKAVESVRLEFKSQVPKKDEVLKKLSAFANTFGGIMVIGAEADSDGRLKAISGVERENNYKQTVVQYCTEGATPPLIAEVSDAIHVGEGANQYVYVVSVPESDRAPHFLNGRKGLYIRTDEFSKRYEAQLATEGELLALLNKRRSVREKRAALLERARHRAERLLVGLEPPPLPSMSIRLGFPPLPRMSIGLVPRFPTAPAIDSAHLMESLRILFVEWRQTTFPQHLNPSSQHESILFFNPCGESSLLEANTWGLVHLAAALVEDQDTDFIHSLRFVGNVLVFLAYAQAVLERLHVSGPLHLAFRLDGVLGRKWLRSHGGVPSEGGPSEFDDSMAVEIDTSMEALQAGPHDVAREVLRTAFFAMNMSDAVADPSKLDRLINDGRRYNFWQVGDNR